MRPKRHACTTTALLLHLSSHLRVSRADTDLRTCSGVALRLDGSHLLVPFFPPSNPHSVCPHRAQR